MIDHPVQRKGKERRHLSSKGTRKKLASHTFSIPVSPIQKQRHDFANKGPSSQGYGFSCGQVWM